MAKTHFHHSDDRFCGDQSPGRRFTFEPGEVTCRECGDRDRLELSQEAAALVAELEAAAVLSFYD